MKFSVTNVWQNPNDNDYDEKRAIQTNVYRDWNYLQFREMLIAISWTPTHVKAARCSSLIIW